jgi:hypothetical protein
VKVLLIVVVLAGVASADRHIKPTAPVTVTLAATAAPGGFDVKLVAVPMRAVPAVTLVLAGKQLTFAATAAGQRRELTVHVAVATGAGLDVIGGATAGGRNKAAVLHVGVAKLEAAKRETIYTLPNGDRIKEVRQ